MEISKRQYHRLTEAVTRIITEYSPSSEINALAACFGANDGISDEDAVFIADFIFDKVNANHRLYEVALDLQDENKAKQWINERLDKVIHNRPQVNPTDIFSAIEKLLLHHNEKTQNAISDNCSKERITNFLFDADVPVDYLRFYQESEEIFVFCPECLPNEENELFLRAASSIVLYNLSLKNTLQIGADPFAITDAVCVYSDIKQLCYGYRKGLITGTRLKTVIKNILKMLYIESVICSVEQASLFCVMENKNTIVFENRNLILCNISEWDFAFFSVFQKTDTAQEIFAGNIQTVNIKDFLINTDNSNHNAHIKEKNTINKKMSQNTYQ